jgi:uncharacterized membrane protein YeiB
VFAVDRGRDWSFILMPDEGRAETRAMPLGEEASPETVAIEPSPRPVASGEEIGRISGLDVARGLAFAGMVAVNYRVVLDPLFQQTEPAILSQIYGKVAGRAAALFVILAGVGATLMYRASANQAPARESFGLSFLRTTGWTLALALAALLAGFHAWSDAEIARNFVDVEALDRLRPYREFLQGTCGCQFLQIGAGILGALFFARLLAERLCPGPRLRLLSRAALLLGLGYAWYPIWNGDILHYYAVFLSVGALLLGLRARWILPMILAIAAGAVYWQLHEDFRADWAMLVLEYENFWEPRALGRNLLFNGWHPILPWLAFFLVGLLLGRGALRSKRFALALILAGVLGAAAGHYGAKFAVATLDRREEQRLTEAFPLRPVDLAEGESLELAAVFEGDAAPRISRRIGLDIEPRVDRDAADRQITDARRLRRYLRATRDRHDYLAVDMSLRPRESAEAEAGLEVVLRLGEDPSRPLDAEAAERFRKLARAFGAWMGERSAPPFGLAEDAAWLNSGTTWPGTLEHLRIERLAPIPAEVVVLDRELAQGLDRRELKLYRLAHSGSWPNPSPFFLIGATGSALALIGLCLLLTRTGIGQRLSYPLATAGRMALSLYVAHIVIGLAILDFAGKMSGQDLPFIALAVSACVWVGVSGACAWQALFGLGPLERLLRWLAR